MDVITDSCQYSTAVVSDILLVSAQQQAPLEVASESDPLILDLRPLNAIAVED
jgi:hypothetical protein